MIFLCNFIENVCLILFVWQEPAQFLCYGYYNVATPTLLTVI